MPSQLLEQLRNAIRVRGYSIRTERAYVSWAVRFIKFHGTRHPQELDEQDINAFLTHLAVRQDVAPNTQNQALSALLFLYKVVLRKPLDEVNAVQAKKPQKLPVVLSRQEVRLVLSELSGYYRLFAALLYGSGLRLMEGLRLRVKDLNFEYQSLHIHDGKGAKDRVVIFPLQLHAAIQVQLQHSGDLAQGLGQVYLPNALSRKYKSAARD
ncbi:MAG: site-specific recombinase XerD, partial [Candidatus Azotimanducaceae bacterium]